MSSHNQGNDKVVIGIDFGTTFTGVAYGYGINPPEPITLWPLAQHRGADYDTPKVPSKIAYAKNRNSFAGPPVDSWGHQAWDDQKAISWFKLLLLEQRDLQSHLTNSHHLNVARGLVDETGKNVITVIAEYLSNVWKHVVEQIEKSRTHNFILARPYHIVVTVPAIWQDYAVQRMESALRQAGILDKRPQCPDTTWTFVSEPEAAALAAIEGHKKYGTLEPGQTFVVADLGGGTVDLISFQVRATEPQIILDEVVEGEGALCGATFLDQAFQNYLENKLRRSKAKDKLKPWQEMHAFDRKRIMSIDWEKGLKRNYYAGGPGQHIDLGAQGKRRPELFLEPSELNDVFDSVYPDIAKLIEGQVNAILRKTKKLPQFIVLTGGFGRCEYIFRKLQQQWEDRLEILCEENTKPWTAVSRGAVLAGLGHINNKNAVRSHVSRYSYGWTKSEDFNCRIHELDDFDKDELTGRQMAKNQMEWIIYRGESVQTQKPRVYQYERFFDIDEIGMVPFSEPIYRSRRSNPPRRLAENAAEEGPASDPAEFQLHVIIDMMTPVPVEKLPKRGSWGSEYRVLAYNVEVNISGASLVIEAMSQGKRIGQKTITRIDK